MAKNSEKWRKSLAQLWTSLTEIRFLHKINDYRLLIRYIFKYFQENEAESVQLADRNHANRVSQFSNDSKYSNSSSNGSSTIIIQHNKDKWTTSVEIERNDSGLGSETGKSGKRPVKIRDKLNHNNNNKTVGEQICEDCDQPIDESAATKRYIEIYIYIYIYLMFLVFTYFFIMFLVQHS